MKFLTKHPELIILLAALAAVTIIKAVLYSFPSTESMW